jgi:acyl-CoA dehydrogenase
MDLELSTADLEFQAEVRAFLDAELTPELRLAGARMTSIFCDPRYSLPWQRILHAKGWVAPSWPVEYGGTGWSEVQRAIWDAECARATAPSLPSMGLKMVAPVIMAFGRPEQKAFYLPRILSTEDYWCQGYSEPGSGSDLASLQLRAESDGDDYVLSGSKIWTTHAHHANRMFCLVRTSTAGKLQQGITFLLLDMDTPGLSVKPIITLAGEHEVNQVFFDEVRVPKANRIGEENQGWSVAKYLLEFERGGRSAAALAMSLQRAQAIAEASFADDVHHRRRRAEAEIEIAAIDAIDQRVLSAVSVGRNPGPISSLQKIKHTEVMQQVDEVALAALGLYAAVDQPQARTPGSQAPFVGPEAGLTATARYLNDRAASIFGGSNEIQRNIIARLMLGL